MSVYCLADFHLSNQVDKPMHKFGLRWINHDLKLKHNLTELMSEDDTLLVPGDISWALTTDEVKKDLLFIDSLPGRKILLRGNHDYWWSTLRKNYRLLEALSISNIDFLQNNAFRFVDPDLGGLLVAGGRGWIFPDDAKWTSDDKRIFEREIIRLSISLKKAEELREEGDRLIVLTHFPPMNSQLAISPFTALLKEHDAEACFFGHIHHQQSPYQLHGEKIDGVPMYLTACDQIDFMPLKVDDCL